MGNLSILIKILEGNFWKEILRKNSEKKEISGYGEGNYFLGVETGNTGDSTISFPEPAILGKETKALG
jgi:hypothetical protein